MRKSLLFVLAAALAFGLAGCGGTTDPTDAGAPPPSASGDASGDASDGAAGGTTMRVYTVSEALDAEVKAGLHVSGLLIDAGDGWRLCGTVLESYPPQCGEPSIALDGVNAAEFDLQEEGDVRWADDATVVGDLHGDTLTITGSAAAS